MKNPIHIWLMYRQGYSFRTSYTAAPPLSAGFYKAVFIGLALASLTLWGVAATVAVAKEQQLVELKEAHIEAVKAWGVFYESQFINCLNWKTAQIQGVVFDCPMKEAKR